MQNCSVNLQSGWENQRQELVWFIFSSREGTVYLDLFLLLSSSVWCCHVVNFQLSHPYDWVFFISCFNLCSWSSWEKMHTTCVQLRTEEGLGLNTQVFWYKWCTVTPQSRFAVTDISLCAHLQKSPIWHIKVKYVNLFLQAVIDKKVGEDTDLSLFLCF